MIVRHPRTFCHSIRKTALFTYVLTLFRLSYGVARCLLWTFGMPDSVLLAAGAALLGSLLPSSWTTASAATTAIAIMLWPRVRTWQKLLMGVMLLGGSLRASVALHNYEAQRNKVYASLGSPALCRATASVISSPVRLGQRLSLTARISEASCEKPHVLPPGTLVRLYVPVTPLVRGDVVAFHGRLGLVEIPRNFQSDTAFAFHARSGVVVSGGAKTIRVVHHATAGWTSWIDSARWYARSRIQATYVPDAVPLARALVLGENDMPAVDAEAFRISGLSHLLAVSGSHIVIAVLGIVRLLEALLTRIEPIAARLDAGRIAALIGLPLTWFYEGFAGSGGSVRRAALMTSGALLARALARRPDGLRAFTLSMLIGTLFDPLAAYDVSFGLSAGATAGLMLLSRPVEARLSQLPPPLRWAAPPIAATLSATVMCVPWLALLSPNLSVAGVFANVVAVPIGEAVSLPACLFHLLLGWWPSAQRGVALLGSGSLLAVRTVARVAAAQSYMSVDVPRPSSWQLATIASALIFGLLHPHRRATTAVTLVLSLLSLEALARTEGHPTGQLRVSVLDVGQGDSILIDFPDGRTMLIDGGGVVGSPVDPGARVVLPVLRARRRRRIDVAVLSHPHPDHFIGLATALPQLEVGEFWDTGQGERFGAGTIYASLLRGIHRRHIPIRHPADVCGHPLTFGGATVRVLAPCPDIDPIRHANNNSFVLKITYGQRSALLVGDAEAPEERDLLRRVPTTELHADFLKAGHHGSDTSSTLPFVRAVHPPYAVLTCGARNRYGHPGRTSVANLRLVGTRLLRSDLNGEVVWSTDGVHTSLRSVVGTALQPNASVKRRQ